MLQFDFHTLTSTTYRSYYRTMDETEPVLQCSVGSLTLIDAIGDATEQNAYKCAARASAYGSTEVRLRFD
jgi:hypothetical protein